MTWCVHREDVLLCHAHTQLWMAVHVACVMDATLMDEAVSTENDSHTLQTAVSSAPVWYQPKHILICLHYRFRYIDLILNNKQDHKLTGNLN